MARALAALLVVVLIGPALVTATCELTCAMASHHHGSAAPADASCHEHQGSTTQGAGVTAKPSSLCHEFGGLPSAVADAWLGSVVVIASPTATAVVSAPLAARAIARTYEPRTLVDPRPAYIPIRV